MSGIAERYSRATHSSHLKLRPEPGDIDVLAAAGMAGSALRDLRGGRTRALGILLLRCRHEWDAQRGEFERMYTALSRERALADTAKADARRIPAKAEEHAARARRIDAEAKAALATSRALALMAMGSLGEAYARFADLAGLRAARLRLGMELPDIADCVGVGLEIWLDRRCGACAGRGFNGGYGVPVLFCKECGASGERRRHFPAGQPARARLGEWVVSFAEEKMRAAAVQIQRRLR